MKDIFNEPSDRKYSNQTNKNSNRKNPKTILYLLMLTALTITTTGCMRIYEDLTINSDDTITETVKQCISKEYIDNMNQTFNDNANTSSSNNSTSDTDKMVLETLEDGQEYYVETNTETVAASTVTDNPLVVLNKDIFYYGISQDQDETISSGYSIEDAIEQSIYMKMTIHLLDDITETNANVKDETAGNTAVFDTTFTESSWYAYTAHGRELIDNDTTPPVVKIAKNSKYSAGIPIVNFSDNIGIASINVNGKAYSHKNFKQGKNTIIATDLSGNTGRAEFYYDTAKPIVKGIKSYKTYKKKAVFYVRDKISLSKVTINGKKKKISKKNLVKKGKYKNYYKFTISKAGNYTIIATDKAGNRSYYYITVK